MKKTSRHPFVKHIPAWTALVFILIGYFFGTLHNPSPEHTIEPITTPENQSNSRHLGRTTFTNPFLDNQGTNESTRSYATLKQQLEQEISRQLSKDSVNALSVYFQDLESEKWLGINETERYAPASLMKVTLLIAYYKIAETEPTILSEEILNDGSYTNLANVPPAQRLALGRSYTINELLENMIVHSNNESQHLLSDYLDQRITPELHMKLIRDSMTLIPASYELGDQYDLTPLDYAGMFRILYNATYLSDTMSERALALLAGSSFDSGIVNGTPEGIITANKFGFKEIGPNISEMQFHDCGIVYAEPNPYILCIMTKTDDPVAAQAATSEISRIVYEAVTQ